MEITLSILIATMPSRSERFLELRYVLETQILLHKLSDEVEIIYDAAMHYNIGTKRNILLNEARGKYIVFCDDDDKVSPEYVLKLFLACDGSDCIGISGFITTNGQNKKQWHISKEYGSWYERGGVYYRTPNHISPVKRELALQAGFPDIAFGEDAEYSRRLLPLLNTETKVEGNIYHYDYYIK